jgi:bifunctional DNA-binding transcriptional regulator/antitoxin component of YhaV-PrlF toxin-antitoxin module
MPDNDVFIATITATGKTSSGITIPVSILDDFEWGRGKRLLIKVSKSKKELTIGEIKF